MSDASSKPSSGRRRLLSLAVQLLGVAVAIGALYWCIHLALKPENQEALKKLRNITLDQALVLAGLTSLSFVLNGLCFWAAIRPRQTIKPIDVIATNFLGTLLAEVPFKLSAVFRVFIHNRRDGVPLLTIGAWFAVVGLAMLLVVGPVAGLSLWRRELDAIWWLGTLLGIPVLAALAMSAARYFGGERGMKRLSAVASRLPGLPLRRLCMRVLHTGAFGQLHSACDMVASRYFVLGLCLRATDVLVQAFRFYFVARMLGIDLQFGASLCLSSGYFMIGVIAPSGSAGSREGGVVAAAKWLGIPVWQSIAPAALTVGACELAILLASVLPAMLILKPWKLRTGAGPARDVPPA